MPPAARIAGIFRAPGPGMIELVDGNEYPAIHGKDAAAPGALAALAVLCALRYKADARAGTTVRVLGRTPFSSGL